MVLKDSRTIVKDKILKNTEKNILILCALKKVEMLMEAIHNSYPIANEFYLVILQVKHCACRYQELIEQKNEITELMDNFANSLLEYDILLSFPGIGINSAVRIIAERKYQAF